MVIHNGKTKSAPLYYVPIMGLFGLWYEKAMVAVKASQEIGKEINKKVLKSFSMVARSAEELFPEVRL